MDKTIPSLDPFLKPRIIGTKIAIDISIDVSDPKSWTTILSKDVISSKFALSLPVALSVVDKSTLFVSQKTPDPAYVKLIVASASNSSPIVSSM